MTSASGVPGRTKSVSPSMRPQSAQRTPSATHVTCSPSGSDRPTAVSAIDWPQLPHDHMWGKPQRSSESSSHTFVAHCRQRRRAVPAAASAST
jgi:hypothetical protein